jgi:hypothetical protein
LGIGLVSERFIERNRLDAVYAKRMEERRDDFSDHRALAGHGNDVREEPSHGSSSLDVRF